MPDSANPAPEELSPEAMALLAPAEPAMRIAPRGMPSFPPANDGLGFKQLLLSVYILVLAFFLMLTSSANFSAGRTKAVMESLQARFGVVAEETGRSPQEERVNQAVAIMGLLGAPERGLEGELKQRLVYRLPVGKIYDRQGQLYPDTQAIFHRLAASGGDGKIRMEMLGSCDRTMEDDCRKLIPLLAAWAESMQQAGMPEGGLRIGIDPMLEAGRVAVNITIE